MQSQWKLSSKIKLEKLQNENIAVENLNQTLKYKI